MRKLLVAALLFVACGGEPAATTGAGDASPARKQPTPPSIEEARELIAASPTFSEFEFTNAGYSLPVDGKMLNDPARAAVRELSKEGWVGVDGDGDLVLTDRSGDDRRFILRPNGILDIVPLAKKEMGEVESVRPNSDGTVEADFNWRWVPNEIGTAFKSGPVFERFNATHAATATLMWNGTDWTLLKIERRQSAV